MDLALKTLMILFRERMLATVALISSWRWSVLIGMILLA